MSSVLKVSDVWFTKPPEMLMAERVGDNAEISITGTQNLLQVFWSR